MGFLIFVGLWIAGAIWGYRRAVASGYSELGAAAGAFLLGPFAPLMGFVKPAGKRCTSCTSIIPTAATVCPKCTRAQ